MAVATEFEDIFHECDSFSVITQNLLRSIGEAQKFLGELKAPTVTNADEEDDSLKHDITFKKYGARKVAHFGSVKYSYGGIVHPTCQNPDSEALNSIIAR